MPTRSAQYQEQYRKRMREKGLVKREAWIPPNCVDLLRRVETALRAGIAPIIPNDPTGRDESMTETWTAASLHEALKASPAVQDGALAATLLQGADPVIRAVAFGREELPVLISVSGDVITCMCWLWPVSAVPKDERARINEDLLRLNPLTPLTAYAIVDDSYVMYGEISARSPLRDVEQEILTLSDNVVDALDAVGSALAPAA